MNDRILNAQNAGTIGDRLSAFLRGRKFTVTYRHRILEGNNPEVVDVFKEQSLNAIRLGNQQTAQLFVISCPHRPWSVEPGTKITFDADKIMLEQIKEYNGVKEHFQVSYTLEP